MNKDQAATDYARCSLPLVLIGRIPPNEATWSSHILTLTISASGCILFLQTWRWGIRLILNVDINLQICTV
jgi:hypothetical protein